MVTWRVPVDDARSSVAPSGLVTERASEPPQAAADAASNESTAWRVNRYVREAATTGRHVATRVGRIDDLAKMESGRITLPSVVSGSTLGFRARPARRSETQIRSLRSSRRGARAPDARG